MDEDERREAAGALLVSARGSRTRRSLARELDVSEATLRQYEHGWREIHVAGEKLRTPANIPEARIPDLSRVYGVQEGVLRDTLGLPPLPPAEDPRPPADVTIRDKGPGVGTGMNRVVVRREGLEVEALYTDDEDRAQVLADIFAAMGRVESRDGEAR